MLVMLEKMHITREVTAQNLQRLFWLRNVMIVFLASTALLLISMQIPLHTLPIGIAVGGMLLLNGITWLRLRNRHATVREGELLGQLLGDIATLTMLFYFTGGYSNPFVWMYLLPLAIAAVALHSGHAWLVTGLVVACYSSLVFFHVPLSHLHVHALEGIGLDIHLAGMWLGFVVSAGIIAVFVARIGHSLREYDRLIAQAREEALESERMLALGTLAAGAAHELGTPLATMAVLTREMREDYAGQPELVRSLELLRTQVDRCKDILSSLAASTGKARAESASSMMLDDFLEQTFQRWRDTRPAVQFDCTLQGSSPAPQIAADRTLGMALVNLLDNAADASPDCIEIQGGWNSKTLNLSIRDYGHGLAPETAARIGTPFFTTKHETGMGLGLYLARMILERFGGNVELNNHPDGGTVTAIRLPLKNLILEHQE
jgi:two-component system sensor histidine kinase RegB